MASDSNLPNQGDISEMTKDDDDDGPPQLSASTLAALQEFYTEQEELKELLQNCKSQSLSMGADNESEESKVNDVLFKKDLNKNFPEDWQLSQFWYDQETSKTLAKEVLKLGANGRIACVSCPSIFRACENATNVDLFEFDKRFEAFGTSFHFYDYNQPENFPETCTNAFSVVVADPPFLSEECLEKVAITVKKLLQKDGKIILCTGAVMEPVAQRTLNLKRASFVPHHTNNLGNEFACFTNYEMILIR